MEFLTYSLNEVLSKLREDKKEEVDVIESIIIINKENRESTKEKVFRFVEKRKPENCINFIIGCINYAANIRPKERESLLFLVNLVLNNFKSDYKIADFYSILKSMLQVKNYIPLDYKTNEHVFDFAEEGTVERAIFEDNVDLLQQLLAIQPDEHSQKLFELYPFFELNRFFYKNNANRIELAALFGSIKCFKFLMMNGDEINEKNM